MTKILLITAFAISSALAQYPIQDMNSRTLGVALNGQLRGQNITAANVASHEILAMLDFSYAPYSWVLLSLGLGFDQFEVDTYKGRTFKGDFGISPQAGLYLYTPPLASVKLRLTGGMVNQILSSEDDFGYTYYGFIHNPFVGLVVSPSGYVDLGAGLRAHWIEGNMKTPASSDEPYFSNEQLYRLYVNLLIRSPHDKVYLNVDLDASPDFGSDWSSGPDEASVGLSVGFLMGFKERQEKPNRAPVYFPEYGDVKDLQDRMSDDLD